MIMHAVIRLCWHRDEEGGLACVWPVISCHHLDAGTDLVDGDPGPREAGGLLLRGGGEVAEDLQPALVPLDAVHLLTLQHGACHVSSVNS